GDAGHRGGMADARLVVHIVGAEERYELTEQERLLVVVLGRADPKGRIRSAVLLDREQLLAHFAQRLVPRDLLPLATGELHRILKAVRVVRHAVLADRRAFRAMRS